MNGEKMKRILMLILTVAAINSTAQLVMPSVFSDNMVLQRNMKIPVWGKTVPEAKVAVVFHGQKRITTADKEGNWKVYLSPISADFNPRKMLIVSGKSKVVLKNILVGEVWLCSGQSNMKFELKHALGAKKYISTATNTNIRFFQADRNNVRDLTAVGYLFALEIFQKIGVPIGLIQSDFGGSIVESWMSSSDLQKWDAFKSDLAKLAKYKNAKGFEHFKKEETKEWFGELIKIDPGFKNKWMNPKLNDSDWVKINDPRASKIKYLKGHNGIVWFRKKIYIPNKFKGKNIVISFERIVGYEINWLNGKLIDKTHEMSSGRWHRRYSIPSTDFKVGSNTIVVCDFANKDRGTPGEPLFSLKIYQKDDPSNEIEYSREWLCKKGYSSTDYPKAPLSLRLGNNFLAIHYNSRIYPIIPFAIRGVLWYQGESNQHNPEDYAELLSTMIKGWRDRWEEGNFPFYFVQIAPFDYGKKRNSAFLREAQFKTLALTTNTGMAVIMDIGEKHNIHPLRKKEVGHRLALWALAKNYGFTNIVFSGPLYENFKIEKNKIILSFNYAKGLKTRDGNSPTDFEIAGEDRTFYPANAKIVNDKIVVSNDKVKKPVAARFAWQNYAQPNLCNSAGLPASSFRTDNWEMK